MTFSDTVLMRTTVNVLDGSSYYKSVTFPEPQRIPATGTPLFDACSSCTVMVGECETCCVERLCI